MTPLAKASGLLGNGAFSVDAHRPHPGLESASQDVPSRVLVSVQGQAAVRADVLPDSEFLVNVRAACRTLLASTPRIHSRHRDTGSFSLVSQDRQEATPCGVRDCPAEPVVPDHSANVQAFHRDQTVATDQVQRSFVMMFTPLVGDVSMKNTDGLDGLASIRSALPLATHGTLSAPQRREFLFEEARVLDDFSVRGGEEVFESNVDAHGGQRTRFGVDFSDVAGQDDEPLVALALNRGRLDAALNGPVDLTPDHPDVLHAESVSIQSDPVAVGRKFDTVEAILGFEARIAWLLSGLHATKKCDKRLVESAHRGLSGGEVETGEVGVIRAQVLELGRLVAVLHRMTVLPIEVAALFEAEVVESAVRFKHDAELALLVSVREKTELEGAAHLLDALRLSIDDKVTDNLGPGTMTFLRLALHPLQQVGIKVNTNRDFLFHSLTMCPFGAHINNKERRAAIPLPTEVGSPLAA